jgi:nucleotide-binding universal stress UspA family protein
MATHASGGFERAWLGSVADVLVRLVDAPVLLIRPHDQEPVRDDGAPHFTHVLIALDGSRCAERALVPAVALARCHAARVTLLRIVVSRHGTSSPLLPHALQFARADVAEREQDARDYIAAQVEELRQEDVNVNATVLVAPQPAHAIMQYAMANDVDLIALGTHGRGPVGRFVLGSMTDAVARTTDVPVLVC